MYTSCSVVACLAHLKSVVGVRKLFLVLQKIPVIESANTAKLSWTSFMVGLASGSRTEHLDAMSHHNSLASMGRQLGVFMSGSGFRYFGSFNLSRKLVHIIIILDKTYTTCCELIHKNSKLFELIILKNAKTSKLKPVYIRFKRVYVTLALYMLWCHVCNSSDKCSWCFNWNHKSG